MAKKRGTGGEIKLDSREYAKARRTLRDLGTKVAKSANKAAMTAAATPVAKAARKGAPKDTGLMKKATTKRVKAYSNGNAIALIGASKAVGGTDARGKPRVPHFYWHLILRSHKPNYPGNDFLTAAYEATKAQALAAAEKKYVEYIAKAAAKAKGGNVIEEAIRALLIGDEAVSEAVGRRVRPLLAGPHDARPYLVYSTDIETVPTYGGTSNFKRANLSISVVADTFGACRDLAAECRRILDGYAGTSEGVAITPCLMQDESEIEQGAEPATEKPVYVRTQTYRVLYRVIS